MLKRLAHQIPFLGIGQHIECSQMHGALDRQPGNARDRRMQAACNSSNDPGLRI